MPRVSIIFAVLLSVTTANAREGLVTSGEHDGFTRIFIHSKQESDWQTKQVGQVFSIRNTNFDFQFNTKDVFLKISKSRLKSARQDRNALYLELNCECNVSATPLDGLGLIVDIQERDLTKEMRLLDDTNSLKREWIGKKKYVELPHHDTTKPKIEKVDTPGMSPKNPDEKGIFRKTGTEPQSIRKRLNGRQIKLIHPKQLTPREDATEPKTCITDDIFHPESWEDGGDFFQQLSKHRNLVISKAEQTDTEAAFNLAKFFASFGFFSEARSTIEAYKLHSKQTEIFSHLLGIIDTNSSEDNQYLEEASSCSTHALIWKILKADEIIDPNREEIIEIFQAFNRWPDQLRTILAPKLGKLIASRDANLRQAFLFSTYSQHSQSEKNSSGAKRFPNILIDEIRKNSTENHVDSLVNLWSTNFTALSEDDREIVESELFAQSETRFSKHLSQTLIYDDIIKGKYISAFTRALDDQDSSLSEAVSFAILSVKTSENQAKLALLSDAIITLKVETLLTDAEANWLFGGAAVLGSERQPDSTSSDKRTIENNSFKTGRNLSNRKDQPIKSSLGITSAAANSVGASQFLRKRISEQVLTEFK